MRLLVLLGLSLHCVVGITIVNRAGWGARPPTGTTSMVIPVPFVVIHHSESPGACTTESECEESMRTMQDYHMDENGWTDIGYNFAIGGDIRAYEGRGWANIGAHTPGFNDRAVGICIIGDWDAAKPPPEQIEAIKEFIEYGISIGRIASNYKLMGHRQAVATTCPGDALYDEIRTWPHWIPQP